MKPANRDRRLLARVAVPVAYGLLVLVLAWLFTAMTSMTAGALIYPLDDTYIHMTMARNLVHHGVWGISPDHFSSSSSSPLWTGLVAVLFMLFGVHTMIPLFLNVLFAVGILWVVHRRLRLQRHGGGRRAFTLFSLLILVPVPYLVMLGLEHTLHVLLVVLFLFGFLRRMDSGFISRSGGSMLHLGLLCALLVMTRMESIFMISAAVLIFLVNRRWKAAWAALAGMVIPLAGYALVSLYKGWYLLPNPVILKGNRVDLAALEGWGRLAIYGVTQLVYNPHLLLLVILILATLAAVYRQRKRHFTAAEWAGMMVLLAIAGHMVFARTGFFLTYYYQMRYEGYLIALAVVFLGVYGVRSTAGGQSRTGRLRQWLIVAMVMVAALTLTERAVRAMLKIPGAGYNTYCHQVHLGRFLARHYADQPVLINDIGATTFYGHILPVDLLGLGDRDMARLIMTNRFSSHRIDRLARRVGARIAVIYPDVIQRAGGLPGSWRKVARWTVLNHVVSHQDTVVFYALDPRAARKLASALERYRPRLPGGVMLALDESSGDIVY